MYSALRRALFTLDPELAHALTLRALNFLPATCFPKPELDPVECMGIRFPHRIGLAAGLDKDGDAIKGLAKLGFAFIEIGTTTPKPQLGNPKPRLFRLPEYEAIINRMGFNNKGVDYLVQQVERAEYSGILGINIGKNKETPNERALGDYLYCLDRVYPHANYIVINISSPNTPGLRELQEGEYLKNLLIPLKERQKILAEETKSYKPLVVKVAPDLSPEALKQLADLAISISIDGIIATNTSNQRPQVAEHPLAKEAGGLSGAPLAPLADETLSLLHQYLGDAIPLIGVGGIMSAEAGARKLKAGATLLQIYSGLIYHGPRLIQDLSRLE